MTDWKTYKGEDPWEADGVSKLDPFKGEGPWDHVENMDKIQYNEGNLISDLYNYVWSNERTGVPITPTHRPCGYWWKDPVLTSYSLDAVTTEPGYEIVYASHLDMFIKTDGGGKYSTSPDGYNWDQKDIINGRELERLYYDPVHGVILMYDLGVYLHKSTDGINWVEYDLSGMLDIIYRITYIPRCSNYYYLTSNPIGSNGTKLHRTKDFITWEYIDRLASYARVIVRGYESLIVWAAHTFYNGVKLITCTGGSVENISHSDDIENGDEAIVKVDGKFIYVAGGLYDGSSWYPYYIPEEDTNFTTYTFRTASNTISVRDDSRIMVASYHVGAYEKALMQSFDRGFNWSRLHTSDYLLSWHAFGQDKLVCVGHSGGAVFVLR